MNESHGLIVKHRAEALKKCLHMAGSGSAQAAFQLVFLAFLAFLVFFLAPDFFSAGVPAALGELGAAPWPAGAGAGAGAVPAPWAKAEAANVVTIRPAMSLFMEAPGGTWRRKEKSPPEAGLSHQPRLITSWPKQQAWQPKRRAWQRP